MEGEWGGDPVRAQNVTYSAEVEADAREREIMELIQHTDGVAEIHNSLRMGTQVTVADAKALRVGKYSAHPITSSHTYFHITRTDGRLRRRVCVDLEPLPM